ncbi:MAG: lipopolysaccharide biosynthesis protein [Burkholderiales bacterium]|nr:lipopolysaccharide biosynthesis protein [Burkholderiales bacterium]
MSLGDSIRGGARWLFFGSVGGQILAFGFGIALARLLAPEDFGMVATIQIFTGLAGFVAAGGMGQALVRAKEVEQADYDLLFTLQLLIGAGIFLMFFLVAPWFAEWYHMPIYADLLRVMAISFLVRPFYNVPSNILFRAMDFKSKTLVGLTCSLVYSIMSLIMALLGYGPWSLIISSLMSPLIGIFMLARFAHWRPGLSFDFRRAREIVRYGYLVSANNIVSYIRGQISNFALSRLLGPGAVGLFNKADSLSQQPLGLISGAVYEPVMRAIAKSQDNLDLVKYLYLRTIKLVCLYTFPAYVLLSWLAQDLILFLFGAKWLDSATPLSILAIAGLFMCLGHPAGALLAAINRLGRELVVQVTSVAVLALGLAIGLQYGLVGAAWALVATHVVSALHISWVASRELGIKLSAILATTIPGLYLGTIVLATFWIVHAIFDDTLWSPFVRLSVYGTVALVSLVIASRVSPFEVVRGELNKIIGFVKNKCRLQGGST